MKINEILTLYLSDNVVSIIELDDKIGIVYDRGDGQNDVLEIPKIVYNNYERDVFEKEQEG